jgi:hypothetical protein
MISGEAFILMLVVVGYLLWSKWKVNKTDAEL